MKEAFAAQLAERGKAQRQNEQELLALYDRYYAGEDCLSRLLEVAQALGRGIAHNVLSLSSHYRPEELEDHLQEIAIVLFRKLERERAEGKRQENIVHTVRRFYKLRACDLRDYLAVHRNGRDTFSLDALSETDEGRTREVIGLKDPRFDREAEDREALYGQLNRLYLQLLLDSDGEPQRSLALLYARVLYQLELRRDPAAMEAAARLRMEKDSRTTVGGYEKWLDAMAGAQEPATTTSVKWCFRRMGSRTLRLLGADSQRSLQSFYDPDLAWSGSFWESLERPFEGKPLAEVVYTQTYTEKKTGYWAETLHGILVRQLVSHIARDPVLNEEVLAVDSPIRSAMIRMKGGRSHDTLDR